MHQYIKESGSSSFDFGCIVSQVKLNIHTYVNSSHAFIVFLILDSWETNL